MFNLYGSKVKSFETNTFLYTTIKNRNSNYIDQIYIQNDVLKKLLFIYSGLNK